MEAELYDESFRDHIATVDDEGKRVWLYPKKPSGKLYKWRTWLSWAFLAFLFSGPFLRIGGQPLLLLGILDRKFVILGVTFWPQDFWMFGLSIIVFILFIVLFTVIYGRLFCGWICPQTIFMEMVFRKIEYWIEGDAGQQRTLAKRPWDREKLLKKSGKQVVFYLISFLIGNTFLAYLIGSERIIDIITHSPAEHLGGFIAMIIFSGVFYFVFAFMREQVCTTICPYGRLQGVMLDRDSIVVAYDFERGEPRGKIRKLKEEEKPITITGDCIDCNLCVAVCPTGIDIRHGTQMECVNCTACIDACDSVMDKVGRPQGLIRFASYNSITEKQPFRFTRRMMAYTAVLAILVIVLGFSLGTRSDVQTTILRTPGMLYQQPAPGIISNLYNIQVVNKTTRAYPIEIRLLSPGGTIRMIGNDLKLPAQEMVKGAFFIDLKEARLTGHKTKLKIEILSGGKHLEEVETSFLGPIN
jgi:cytochrome c oxidase accessory protein FixG